MTKLGLSLRKQNVLAYSLLIFGAFSIGWWIYGAIYQYLQEEACRSALHSCVAYNDFIFSSVVGLYFGVVILAIGLIMLRKKRFETWKSPRFS
jgi:hypothetical protein